MKKTKFIKVVVNNRNPETESQSGFVGGNNIVMTDGGKGEIKHYRFQVGKEIEIPESFVDQLKNRSHVVKDKKSGEFVKQPIYIVEAA